MKKKERKNRNIRRKKEENAGKMREEGYEVRILGEGANGGNITYPGTYHIISLRMMRKNEVLSFQQTIIISLLP